MYLVPVLVAVDASNPTSARRWAEEEPRERAVHVGAPGRPSPTNAALAEFELRVYANHIELRPPPSRTSAPGTAG